jgi:hypothetical protein
VKEEDLYQGHCEFIMGEIVDKLETSNSNTNTQGHKYCKVWHWYIDFCIDFLLVADIVQLHLFVMGIALVI